MKRRLLALLMSLVMILSVLPGAAFAEPADSSDVLTYADLADIDSSITIPDGASASEELSVADAVRALLLWTGMSEKQLGTFPADYLALARSMGMISADTDTDAACTLDAYRQMKAVANTMYDALHADKLQPLYMNGMAQPIFPYTTGSVETGYSNADSDVIRYCVYVETNYDTDDDGKLDLVKAVVQVPRAAVEGNYKAATIYEARPYITGCNDSMSPGENLGSESYDISKLYSQPAARTPAGSATTAQAAARELAEETHAQGLALTPIGLFSTPGRDPRGWTISHAFAALADAAALDIRADDDAADARWFDIHAEEREGLVDLTLTGGGEILHAAVRAERRDTPFGEDIVCTPLHQDGLAFDHSAILCTALLRLR